MQLCHRLRKAAEQKRNFIYGHMSSIHDGDGEKKLAEKWAEKWKMRKGKAIFHHKKQCVESRQMQI